MRKITVGENDNEQRLDRFLSKYLPGAEKSYLQKMVRKKRIKLNGKKASSDAIIKTGDYINFYIYEEELEKFEQSKKIKTSKINLQIIYRDGNIAVIDKPVGILSHAAKKADYGNNIADAFESLLIETGEYVTRLENSFKPAIANRLDFNTAGLIIGLKNHAAAMTINEALKNRKIDKYYLAFCKGRIEKSISIDKNLDKQGKNMRVSDEGKHALTLVKPLKIYDDASLVEVKLMTGRYHQIRAHMASIGHPLIGDRRYGRPEANFGHQLLLAYKLKFKLIEGLEYLNNLQVKSKQEENFIRAYEANKI